MPEYLSPGVYVEEINTGPRPIEGVSTSTAGMVGPTERGPESARLVTSWLEYQRWYGGYIPDISYLTYAVRGFFDNGGQRCYIARVTRPDSVLAFRVFDHLVISANGRGAWGNRVKVAILKATQKSDWFQLQIGYYLKPDDTHPDMLEIYDNLSSVTGANNNVIAAVNSASRLVKLAWSKDGPARPADTQAANAPPAPVVLENGMDGPDAQNTEILSNHFEGSDKSILSTFQNFLDPNDAVIVQNTGLVALEKVDDISLLMAPDEVRWTPDQLTEKVKIQCESLKDRFAIVSAPSGNSDPGQVLKPFDTTYAAYYYPWIEIFDPSINAPRLIPPTGHIAGVYARTDIERGVHKAPANEVLRGARNLEFPISKGIQDVLNPRNVNCMRDFRGAGRDIRIWGARTMSSDGAWKYVNVRRLFLFIEESIDKGTQWVVFEPNYETTWAGVTRSITGFLTSVWRSGALAGTTPEAAFFVKCDRTTMTQDDIDNGRLICYIGVAPAKPAEFVIFRISQKTVEAAG